MKVWLPIIVSGRNEPEPERKPPCTCGHTRFDHEFDEDCSQCYKCGCIEYAANKEGGEGK